MLAPRARPYSVALVRTNNETNFSPLVIMILDSFNKNLLDECRQVY